MPKNRCFACGKDNPEGLHLHFHYNSIGRSVECSVKISAKYQGATGFAHGGIIATLLDEAMAKVNGMGGVRAVTVKLNITYRKMVPVWRKLQLHGRRTKRSGRKLYLRSELRDPDGVVLAEASGLFLTVLPAS